VVAGFVVTLSVVTGAVVVVGESVVTGAVVVVGEPVVTFSVVGESVVTVSVVGAEVVGCPSHMQCDSGQYLGQLVWHHVSIPG